MALCSLSTGRTFTPLRRAAPITASPAMTRISLLATAMSLPASIAASAGREPAGADDGDQDHVRLGHRRQFHQAIDAIGTGRHDEFGVGKILPRLAQLFRLEWADIPTISIRSGISRATLRALTRSSRWLREGRHGAFS